MTGASAIATAAHIWALLRLAELDPEGADTWRGIAMRIAISADGSGPGWSRWAEVAP